MSTDAVAEIKSRLDIVDVVGGYVRLQRSGRDHKALCPFHSERTPSFHVTQERQAWYCFGCNEGGDLFTFVEKIERVDFPQALQLLAERAGVELAPARAGSDRRAAGRRRARALDLSARAQAFYEHVLWASDSGAPGRALLDERGVSEDLARLFGVGFAPAGGSRGDALSRYLIARGHATAAEIAEAGLAHASDRGGGPRDRFRHRLVFPIRDERGRTCGFGARGLGDERPKYLNTPATAAYDKSQALFGIDLARPAIAEAGAVVVVEGYFDVIAAHVAGVRHVVASSGTALTPAQVRHLGRLARSVVLCFDADEAGQMAVSRATDLIAAEGLEGRICVLPPDVKDPDELVRREPAGFATVVASAPREWQVLLDRALSGAEGGSLEARRAGAERAVGLLARIPQATTRELYTQQAAQRLELRGAAVAADVGRVIARRRPTGPLVIADRPVPAEAATASSSEEAAQPLSALEQYIGCLAVQRPQLARALVDTHGLRPEELRNGAVRHLVEVARAVPMDAAFPLHRVAPAEQRLAARLALRSVPELSDPDAVERLSGALSDSARRVHEAALRSLAAAVRRELHMARDDGRPDAEVDGLARRLHGLSCELENLRSGAAVG